MKEISLDYSKASWFVSQSEIDGFEPIATKARQILIDGTGQGADYLGWIDLPINYDKEEYNRIKKAADKIRSDSHILLVAGIGGSYLGAKAAIDCLTDTFHNMLDNDKRDNNPRIIFCGNSISPKYIADLKQFIGDNDFSINVISKSGTTTETSIAFRIFKEMLIDRYGDKEAAKRIYATTDKKCGALREVADREGYETFVIPDNIGGRYSVLTAVGLLPIAVAGIDIDAMMAGAADIRDELLASNYSDNDAMKYAAIRNILYQKGKSIEIIANYEPTLHYIAEWWKQLYGESEGKECKGIFPASVDLTTDLHSMGQFIQDGSRIIYETVLNIVENQYKVMMNREDDDADGMNYLAGKDIDFVNKQAMNATILAHTDGKVPNLRIDIQKQDAYCIGALFYFFEFACGISGYILGINPFDQPGVESYKKNMFALLGKPGYEDKRDELLRRL